MNTTTQQLKLFVAHVGFYDPEIGIYELHSNFFVVAPDAAAAKQAIKRKEIFINKRMHIDGIQEISMVDGYRIYVEAGDAAMQNQTYGYDAVKSLPEA